MRVAKIKLRPMILFCLLIFCGFSASSEVRSVFTTVGRVIFGLTGMDSDLPSVGIPVVHNKEVKKYITLYQKQGRAFFGKALARSTRYLPLIEKIFSSYNVPRELAYLALIESGYNNKAISSAYAVGMWQFMFSTGRGYGLKINYQVDERRDFYKATKAAARYLRDLYAHFGDWYLSLAAYNAGAGYISKMMRKTGAKDYWTLAPHLYAETQQYVPRFLAAFIIGMYPANYGFGDLAFQKPLRIVPVKMRGGVALSRVSSLYNISMKRLRRLNPHLKRATLPYSFSGYEVNLPANVKPVNSGDTGVVVMLQDGKVRG